MERPPALKPHCRFPPLISRMRNDVSDIVRPEPGIMTENNFVERQQLQATRRRDVRLASLANTLRLGGLISIDAALREALDSPGIADQCCAAAQSGCGMPSRVNTVFEEVATWSPLPSLTPSSPAFWFSSRRKTRAHAAALSDRDAARKDSQTGQRRAPGESSLQIRMPELSSPHPLFLLTTKYDPFCGLQQFRECSRLLECHRWRASGQFW
ncbi:hypothetical protein HBI10_192540 [Parastagonospora nodorum]|nr:hypothetical protein HBI10_192540 [Parastagonospora nodorum]KAH6025172.1 hypothetical protein HBI54_246650 [Parastagonospora nodorum]